MARKKQQKLFVEGYHDHKSAVDKIAADLDLDPKRVDATIRFFFNKIVILCRNFKSVYLRSFGKFNNTLEGSNAAMLKDKKHVLSRRQRFLKHSENVLKPRRLAEKKAREDAEPWPERIIEYETCMECCSGQECIKNKQCKKNLQ